MHRHWRAFYWISASTEEHGNIKGTAYQWTVRSLQRKLYNLWGRHIY